MNALTEAREEVLAQAETPVLDQALATLAGLVTAERFGEHVRALQADTERFASALRLGPDLARAQRRVLGVTADSDDELVAGAVTWLGEGGLRAATCHRGQARIDGCGGQGGGHAGLAGTGRKPKAGLLVRLVRLLPEGRRRTPRRRRLDQSQTGLWQSRDPGAVPRGSQPDHCPGGLPPRS